MKLNDVAARKAKPEAKPYKMADGGGMYLEVMPNGSKYWRFKYRFGGKEKRLAFGVYPDVPLSLARERREKARKLLAEVIDPGEVKHQSKRAKRENAENSFEAVAREWFTKHRHTWAASHANKIINRLENDVFPWIGSKPIADIKAPELLGVLRRTESRGALDTAHRVKQNCGQVFRYAVATGRAERDPSQDLRSAIPPAKKNHFASITDPVQVGELLRAIQAFRGTFVVQTALRLAPLLFVRPGELRRAEWKDFDLDKAEWRYFVTKTKTEHSVPLADRAVAMLRDLYALTGHGHYVFPGRDPKKPMSDAAVNAALRRMGYDTKTEITGHGFRAMARTILAEELHQKPEVIEHQLAHKVPDTLGTAYNRTKFLKERREMMQLWADYLDELVSGAEVVQLRA
ncbi:MULTISPECIES: tyrosine-type recombinase/integrase [unclassified Nitrosospira]|uniref:tyrosine-type recombinase/integrase n=1 Tax=unclassified Nitrosospira TaxID=2609267 RepID=UPI000D32063F|nr:MULTISPECIES: integrase arm-type DNA-binding domain-containing protein [unclassified Nitrosospira]PTR14514.1 integrase [Nitrosospira sp. Nsp2]WON72465.1 tyrosine-type recombinase/integrase [Nitrosospira sp. Is2]